MANGDFLYLPVPVSERDHIIGPSNASVTVVKYGDYECPDCQREHRTIEKLLRELLDRVRFVYRHFPLIKVHPRALRAAEAAEAAGAQGKFWEMNRQLFINPGKLEDKDLHRYARKIGLDLDRFEREMSEGVYAEAILRDRDFSINHGISGTPTFFVNDRLCPRSGRDLIDAVKALIGK